MLINVSNHPSSGWKPIQKDAATSKFGEIIDIAFPEIPANWNGQEVKILARQTLQQVLQDYNSTNLHILINGEQSFVCYFVWYCFEMKIPCYTATSRRMVHANSDGSKTVFFEFERFRHLIP